MRQWISFEYQIDFLILRILKSFFPGLLLHFHWIFVFFFFFFSISSPPQSIVCFTLLLLLSLSLSRSRFSILIFMIFKIFFVFTCLYLEYFFLKFIERNWKKEFLFFFYLYNKQKYTNRKNSCRKPDYYRSMCIMYVCTNVLIFITTFCLLCPPTSGVCCSR